MTKRMTIAGVSAVCLLAAVLALAFTSVAAAPGKASPGEPGGTVWFGAPGGQFTDNDTGTVYELHFGAAESTDEAGRGQAGLILSGPNLSLCDTHGPGALRDDFPLPQIQCVGSGDQGVSVEGCKATVEMHGYIHSDYPNVTYMGSTTINVLFHKDAGKNTGVLTITAYTPKGPIRLHGSVTAPAILMDTCP